MEDTLKRSYTVKEIAEDLHVHDETVRRWIDRGVLKAFKNKGEHGPGMILRVWAVDYDAFIKTEFVQKLKDKKPRKQKEIGA